MLYELPYDVLIKVNENGFVVVPNEGEKTFFDKFGNKIPAYNVEEEEHKNYPENFDFMGVNERNLVRKWFAQQKANNIKMEKFLDVISKAICEIDYDYCIANLEPSFGAEGKIYYEVGETVADGFGTCEWVELANKFSPSHKSEMATLNELFLWYAWRIAKGYWTIEYVCNNSSESGNYSNSSESSGGLEVSGSRIVGGRRDGIGNTYKLVKNGEFFAVCSGFWDTAGSCCPVADVFDVYISNIAFRNVVGVVVLKKF